MSRCSIRLVPQADLLWEFGDKPPYYNLDSPGGTWPQRIEVDPAPGYAHDLGEARKTLARCQVVFRPLSPVAFHLLHHEVTSRTNGQSWRCYHTKKESKHCKPGAVLLSGKRIPPHPAMTRYLIAHEYGHHVQWWIEHKRGQDERDLSTLRAEYARLRRMAPVPYGPGTWHASVGEVFANDFRVLIAKVETEFWPHDVTRPEDLKAVRKWWRDALR